MDFRIADTFTDSLARLTGEEQKAAKITVFDLHANPVNPGMQLHRLDKSKDKHFWSVRVGRNIRLIVHKTESSLLVCYVGHHDDAYRWAERRKLEVHPKTGAAQFVVIRETVVEVAVRKAVDAVFKKPKLFSNRTDAELLGFGVPPEWLSDVKQADEDTLLDVAAYLPGEAAEALLQIATGGTRESQVKSVSSRDTAEFAEVEAGVVEFLFDIDDEGSLGANRGNDAAFAHRDVQRRFRLIENREELERALEYPWDKWATFLHPAQREVVDRNYSGPARVSGSAGTGKTIVALHRAVHLARVHGEARILLTTFSETLAQALKTKLRRLVGNEPRLAERIDVHSLDAIGARLYKSLVGPLKLISRSELREVVRDASKSVGEHKFSARFLVTEWDQIVDAWQLNSWEAYRDVARLGRKTRLAEPQRRLLWSIYESVQTALKARGLITAPSMFSAIAAALSKAKNAPFDFAVIDESQDISVPQLRLLAALGRARPDALFFAGDLGQRIFQQPFSWKSLGVDVRGRSKTLRVNYRTSHQIRTQADRLLSPEVADVDGNNETRSDTVSVFNGPPPEIKAFDDAAEESAAVSNWLAARIAEGLLPHEIAVFVRSEAELSRAEAAVALAKLPYKVLDKNVEVMSGSLSICTMHLAKGLEFRAVAVMACDDEIIPSQQRIEEVGDDADLQEVYETERHLLYVACTRSRDQLILTSVRPASEFLDDMHTEHGYE